LAPVARTRWNGIHDLRHSFASDASELGKDLTMIGRLLGHTQIQTTARYAHLKTDPIRAAANNVADAIALDLTLPVHPKNEADVDTAGLKPLRTPN
jgi:integrase